MSQGYLEGSLAPLTHLGPISRPGIQKINQILSTKGRIPPSIWQDPLARPVSPAGPTGKITCTAYWVQYNPYWNTRIQQGTWKPNAIELHANYM